MEELIINAAKRDVFGKKNRFLRRQGITPTHLIGHSIESQALQCDTTELVKIVAHAGETRVISLKIEGDKQPKNVFVREIQRDALGKRLLHVDFYQVRKGQKMQVAVPIVLFGESPAMKGKGRMLAHGITELSIECLPENVPPQIEVDVSVLEELEQSIFVKDIVLDPEVTVHADPEQMIVKVTEVQLKVEEEVVEAEEEGVEGEAEAEEGARAEGEPEKSAGGAAPESRE